jgi:hypothetical protein
MARALEVLDATLRKIEQGEINSIEALDHLLVEELTLRENRRVKAALMWARLSAIKTLAGFDFALQPSLDSGPPPMKWSDSKYGFATEEGLQWRRNTNRKRLSRSYGRLMF